MKKLLFIMFLLMVGCSSVDVSKPNNNTIISSSTTNISSGTNKDSTTNKTSNSNDSSTGTSSDKTSNVSSSSSNAESSTSTSVSTNESTSTSTSSTNSTSSNSSSVSSSASSSSNSSNTSSSTVSSSSTSSSSSSASSVTSSSSSSSSSNSSSKEEVITIDEIKISGNYQINYTIGDSLNIEGLKLTVIYSNSTNETIDVTNDMLSNDFDMSIAGEKVITITYEGLTTSFSIMVEEAPIIKIDPVITISIEDNAELVIGEDNEPTIDVSEGAEYTIEYFKGETSVGNTFPTQGGTYTLTVSVKENEQYNSLTQSVTFTLIEKLTPEINISIENNAELIIGEDEMPIVTVTTGLNYTVEYKTEDAVSLGNTCPNEAGTYTITVNVAETRYYTEATKSIAFTLVEKTTPDIQVSIQDNAELVVGKVPVITVSDDLPYTVEYFKDGNSIGNTFPTEEGTYTLTITVNGDKYHYSNTATITFTLINEYNIVINNTDGAVFTENKNSSAVETKVEYMVTVTLAKDDIITIKDANGNLINDLEWENTKTKGSYTVTIDGEHTLYLKFRTDGTITVWVATPEVPVDPLTQPIKVYFSNPENWTTVNAYIWDNNGTTLNGAWPGTQMKFDSESGLYYVDNVMPGNNIIFNNGSSQTADLKVPTDGSNLCTISNGECKWTKITLENYLYVNNVKSELFSINENCTTYGVAVEFYLTITLNEGDVISIKDTNGNSVGIIYWENIDSKNDYVAPCDGEFTIYYKVHEDGGRSVWVGEPTVLTGNFGGLH